MIRSKAWIFSGIIWLSIKCIVHLGGSILYLSSANKNPGIVWRLLL